MAEKEEEEERGRDKVGWYPFINDISLFLLHHCANVTHQQLYRWSLCGIKTDNRPDR